MVFENKWYSCRQEGHIFGSWSPQDRTHIRRVCVVPGCGFVESKKALA